MRLISVFNLQDFHEHKKHGQPIVCATAYDATFAALLERNGIDVILVGDSLGMVVQGQTTTSCVTVKEILYHTRCVCAGIKDAFVMVDMPYCSCPNAETIAENARRIAGVSNKVKMLKVEVDRSRLFGIISIKKLGMPVCAHIGFLPQLYGNHQKFVWTQKHRAEVLDVSIRSQDLGADILLAECVPHDIMDTIKEKCHLPVIGIGSGSNCDGQIMVLYDILGISRPSPSFAKPFRSGGQTVEEIICSYRQKVCSKKFPAVETSDLVPVIQMKPGIQQKK